MAEAGDKSGPRGGFLMETVDLEWDEDEPETSERDDQEFGWEEYLQDDIDPYCRLQQAEEEYLTCGTRRTPSLRDVLLTQLHIIEKDHAILEIGEFLIDSLDENGYLSTSLDQIAEKLERSRRKERKKRPRITLETVESTLKLIQTFEPSGIGARDLKECLLLQIRDKLGVDRLEGKMVEKHLVDLEKRNYAHIARSLGVSEKRVIRAREFISSLEPKPGSAYSSSHAGYITPDIVIDEKDGELVCMLNESDFPHLRIAKEYSSVLANPKRFSRQERDFIRERINKAKLLIAGLERKRTTLWKLINLVKEQQLEFVEKGMKYLKPVTMRSMAQEIGVNERTVSRAVSKKYIKTPAGVFDFAEVIRHSPRIVMKERIKDLVNGEHKSKPLSDSQITAILQKEGYNVKRRAITKCRAKLRIPPSRLRKGM